MNYHRSKDLKTMKICIFSFFEYVSLKIVVLSMIGVSL